MFNMIFLEQYNFYGGVIMKYLPENKNLSPDYKFVWGDEFDGDELDANKWTLRLKMGGNKRVIVSSDPDTIYLKDSKLHLVAHKMPDGTYRVPTSVITQDKMNFKYGYAEIKAKVPYMKGVWPSFWTQSTANRHMESLLEADCKGVMAEVDIFEIFANNRVAGNIISWALDPTEANPNRKSWAYADAFKTQAKTFTEEEFKTINDEYHVYGYEWDEDFVRMYFDGELYCEIDIKKSYFSGDAEARYFEEKPILVYNDRSFNGMECFQDPQYLIFNNHLFDEGVSMASRSVTEFPEFESATYSIEYCRVFQKDGVGEFKAK